LRFPKGKTSGTLCKKTSSYNPVFLINKNRKAVRTFHAVILILELNLFFPASSLFAQVGINTDGSSPQASAMLDIKSTEKGFLVPRMTASQREGIGSPVSGLLVYQTDAESGFYYYSGSAWAFIGRSDGSSGNVVDVDGNVYPTVVIGDLVWMGKNLRATHYRSGAAINLITDNSAWTGAGSGAYCWYNDSIKYQDPYGAIYNWYAVTDSRNICPTGWHVPSYDEYTAMITFCGGMSLAGGVMKATLYWSSPNTGAGNNYGFSSYPSGYRSGDDGTFHNLGLGAGGWCSTDVSGYGYGFNPTYNSASVSAGTIGKTYGVGVRCIRDY
jgi:uncharacterized protein (TIGR02145 family)